MHDHLKIIKKGSKNLRCEHPEQIRNHSFIGLPSQKLCDIPIIIRLAIQDIQTYSVIVTWQSRNQNGLNGYQVAYFAENNPIVVSFDSLISFIIFILRLINKLVAHLCFNQVLIILA